MHISNSVVILTISGPATIQHLRASEFYVRPIAPLSHFLQQHCVAREPGQLPMKIYTHLVLWIAI